MYSAEPPKDLLRFSTAGSVDDGKSTLVGRLLYDSGNIYDDHLKALEKASKKTSYGGSLALALVTDGLKAEQEQGITIDVAYRYFSTSKRRFILADSPGHEQYTRNMATGASTAHLTVILLDASKGILPQTKRHAFIGALMGVPRLLVAVNKMDLVSYSCERFEQLRNEFSEFANKLGVRQLEFIPVSALEGDNVVTRTNNMPWYQGPSVLEYLENVYIGADANLVDLRLPIQGAIRAQRDYRGYTTQVASGVVRVGDEVMVLPTRRVSRIKSIDVMGKGSQLVQLAQASVPQSVTVTLEDELDVARGYMLVRPQNVPHIQKNLDAMLVWMGDTAMNPGASYILQHTTRSVKVSIEQSSYNIDIATLSRVPGAPLATNEIGRVQLRSSDTIFFDCYERNRSTGNFILIDPDTSLTVAAGMLLERGDAALKALDDEGKVSQEIHREVSLIDRAAREKLFGGIARTYWFTGLSGSGKSTVAKAFEASLFQAGRAVYRLDGDNLRFGLNRDLGFSAEDRTENIRRAAEVARLFNDAGLTVICALISPFEKDRAEARKIIGDQNFVEVYFETPLEICEQRDPHGLYLKARSGEIKDFTGVSSPYEAPKQPQIRMNTGMLSLEKAVSLLMQTTVQERK